MRKSFVALLGLAILGTGCSGAIQAVQIASAGFMSARAGYQGYNAVKMAKEIRRAEPVFEEYEGIKAQVELNTDNEELQKAFLDNMNWIIENDLRIAGLDHIKVCSEECPAKTLVVQLRETGYGETTAQKLLAGEKLRAKLYYIDAQTGRVIKEVPLEVASNYIDLAKEVNLAVGVTALKSVEKQGDKEKLQKAVDEFNKFFPVKEEYVELFKRR